MPHAVLGQQHAVGVEGQHVVGIRHRQVGVARRARHQGPPQRGGDLLVAAAHQRRCSCSGSSPCWPRATATRTACARSWTARRGRWRPGGGRAAAGARSVSVAPSSAPAFKRVADRLQVVGERARARGRRRRCRSGRRSPAARPRSTQPRRSELGSGRPGRACRPTYGSAGRRSGRPRTRPGRLEPAAAGIGQLGLDLARQARATVEQVAGPPRDVGFCGSSIEQHDPQVRVLLQGRRQQRRADDPLVLLVGRDQHGHGRDGLVEEVVDGRPRRSAVGPAAVEEADPGDQVGHRRGGQRRDHHHVDDRLDHQPGAVGLALDELLDDGEGDVDEPGRDRQDDRQAAHADAAVRHRGAAPSGGGSSRRSLPHCRRGPLRAADRARCISRSPLHVRDGRHDPDLHLLADIRRSIWARTTASLVACGAQLPF